MTSELALLSARYRERVRDELATRPPAAEGLRAAVDARMRQLLRRDGVVLSATDAERLIAEVVDDAAGLGPLERLMRDPSVTEVMVNGPGEVWVEREGLVAREEIAFRDAEHLRHVIARIVGSVGRRVDESSPMVDARLPDGSRVNVVLPPLALDGPLLTIRRFRAAGFSLDELAASGSLTDEHADLLRACVRGRLNVVISGGTGSGKTTLLNAVARTLDPTERIVTVEDAAELRLDLPHVVRLESRPPNVEGKGEITLRALVRNALRMAVRGSERGIAARRCLPRVPAPVAHLLRARAHRRRERRIEDQLHVVVAELAGQLRAGRSISQAIEAAADELPPPASEALALAANRTALGVPAWQALGALGSSADVRLVAAVVEVQASCGGDLVELLDGLAEVLVERRGLRRMAAVATAQASTTGHIVTGMPALGLVALWLLDHAAVTELLASPVGWAALAMSGGLAGAGNLMIRRLAAVEP